MRRSYEFVVGRRLKHGHRARGSVDLYQRTGLDPRSCDLGIDDAGTPYSRATTAA
jgi:hypothetical protein